MKFFLILPVFWPKLTKIPVGGCYRINQNCHPCSTVDSLELLKSFTNFPITEIQHRSQIGSYNYLNCYMKVVYYIFSKNLSSRNCLKVDSDYPKGTCENVVYHFHVNIQIIITSYLRPVSDDGEKISVQFILD